MANTGSGAEGAAVKGQTAAEGGPPAELARNVPVLGLVSLLTDISSEMLVPVIPLFLTATLGAPVAAVGVIEGVAEGTASVLKGPAGWLSDRSRRRGALVAAGYALSAAGKALLAGSFVWPLVLLARFVDRAGKGVRTAPRDALLADSVRAHAYGRAFGLHRALDTVGAVLGPLITVTFLAAAGERYRILFLLALVPAFLGLLALKLIREPRRSVGSPATGATDSGGSAPSPEKLGRPFLLFAAVSALFPLGNSSDAFIILRSRDLGLTVVEVVAAYTVFNVVYAGGAVPFGGLADRLGREQVLAGGWALFAVVYATLGATDAAWAPWPLLAVYGLSLAMTEGVGRALAAGLAPPQRRGQALGAYHAALGFALLAASVTAGLLWELVSVRAPFFLGAGTAALATAALLVLVGGRRLRPP